MANLANNIRDEWNNLRLSDFTKVRDYHSAMIRIVSKLRLHGEIITDAEMLEKTYTTFHTSKLTFQQQCRLQGYTKYSELFRVLLVEEQGELLIKNQQSHPPRDKAFPEANEVTIKSHKRGRRYKRSGSCYKRKRGETSQLS